MQIQTATSAPPPSTTSLSWGLLRLSPADAKATYAGQALPLARSELALLACLMARAGEFVDEATVEAVAHGAGNGNRNGGTRATVRVVGRINRILEQHCSKAYYVMHVPGTGFGLALPGLSPRPRGLEAAAPATASALPRLRNRVVGRAHVSAHLVRTVPRARLLSLVGAGGIGKTTSAIDVATRLMPDYPDGSFFVDLSFLSRLEAVPATIAAALHMPAPGSATVADIVAFLRTRHLLLLLDNCEHLVETVARLCEAIFDGAPRCHLIVTSREPLRCRGELVYRLQCLPTPLHGQVCSAGEALGFASVELFTERLADRLPGYRLHDADARAAAEICRRLDGLPLAIELLAALGDRYTLAELSERLARTPLAVQNERQPLPARHRSLQTLLEWSHGLLSPVERRTFERLSVFRSSFSLAAALEVAGDAGSDDANTIATCIVALASKSLVVLEPAGDGPVCRLLETTRAFALARLSQSTGWHPVSRRHAQYLCDVFTRAREQASIGRPAWLKVYGGLVNDVRAALDWSFSPGGDVRMGLALTVASTPLAHQLSLWDEYMALHERAISHVDVLGDVDPAIELRLRWAMALFVGQNLGPRESMMVNYRKGLAVAKRGGDPALVAAALDGVWMGAYLSGDYPQALALARTCDAGKRDGPDAVAAVRTARMLIQSQHFMARYDALRALADRLLDRTRPMVQPMSDPAIDPQVSIRVMLARTLWIQGHPAQAAEVMADAMWRTGSDYSVGAAHAIAWGALPVALWRGDHDLATDLLVQLDRHCADFKLPYWQSWVGTYRNGLPEPGPIEWPGVHDAKQLDTLVTVAPHAIHPIALERALAGKAPWCQAEVLRARGQSLLDAGGPSQAEGLALIERALRVARAQGALGWELRCALSLARHWRLQARTGDAQALLAGTCARFAEGFDTADLREARALLEGLATHAATTPAGG